MRIHVALDKELLKSREELERTALRIMQQLQMTDVNQRRLHRFALMTGVAPDHLDLTAARSLRGVASVSVDDVRWPTDVRPLHTERG